MVYLSMDPSLLATRLDTDKLVHRTDKCFAEYRLQVVERKNRV